MLGALGRTSSNGAGSSGCAGCLMACTCCRVPAGANSHLRRDIIKAGLYAGRVQFITTDMGWRTAVWSSHAVPDTQFRCHAAGICCRGAPEASVTRGASDLLMACWAGGRRGVAGPLGSPGALGSPFCMGVLGSDVPGSAPHRLRLGLAAGSGGLCEAASA